MNGIAVSVTPPTRGGRLYPRYDRAAGILAVQSNVQRPWPFGVDIDGRLVFDLDDQRVLANFDLHVPKSRWTRGPVETFPSAQPGDLIFSLETVQKKSFSLPLSIRTDSEAKYLRVEFGSIEPNRAIGLSDVCVALLSSDQLVGFVIQNFG